MTASCYRYLLDTNILSDLIKHPDGTVAQKIAVAGIEQLCCTSLVVACELRYGACKKSSPKLTAKVEQLLDILPVLSLEENIKSRLRMTVVTANVREFSRVPGLAVENWLEEL